MHTRVHMFLFRAQMKLVAERRIMPLAEIKNTHQFLLFPLLRKLEDPRLRANFPPSQLQCSERIEYL